MCEKIPYGYCKCGCGQKTRIAPYKRTDMGWTKGEPIDFISGHNMRGRNMEKSNPWKGGMRINGQGYKMIYIPDHERSDQSGYVKYHIFIAEKALGKNLHSKAVVHHHSKEQFVICEDQKYHMLLHLRARAMEVCGHVDWRKCNFCKKYDAPENLFISLNHGSVRHRSCYNEYQKNKKEKVK